VSAVGWSHAGFVAGSLGFLALHARLGNAAWVMFWFAMVAAHAFLWVRSARRSS
jgi:hypothetical protein